MAASPSSLGRRTRDAVGEEEEAGPRLKGWRLKEEDCGVKKKASGGRP